MKKLKALQKNESGVILVYVLLALALGGIIIGPLLGFMGTGLKASQTHAVETELLYSSEAGIQDAFWRIQNNSTGLPRSPADPALQYTLPDSINGKTISVTIERINTTTFKIVATAAGPDNSQSTSIETYAGIVNLTMFTEGAITSPGSPPQVAL